MKNKFINDASKHIKGVLDEAGFKRIPYKITKHQPKHWKELHYELRTRDGQTINAYVEILDKVISLGLRDKPEGFCAGSLRYGPNSFEVKKTFDSSKLTRILDKVHRGIVKLER